MKKKSISLIFAAMFLLVAGVASAGTAAIPYANTLPALKIGKYLAVGHKANTSQSKIVNKTVGSTYKANMWIQKGAPNGSRVSAIATNVTDNDTRHLTVDHSGIGYNLGLIAENTAWVAVSVDIAGNYHPDTR